MFTLNTCGEVGMENVVSEKEFKRYDADAFVMAYKRLINIPISVGGYDDYVTNILELASNHISSYVCVMNVHMLIEAYYKKTFKNVVENASIVTPDGKPLTWALHLLKKIHQERVTGMDLLPSLLTKAQENNLSVYFYGGSQSLLNKTHKHLEKQYPHLHLAGSYSPPYRELSEEEDGEIIQIINASKANIVFVVLGCPKQEKWMASMKGKINAVMIGIGGALPVMVGMQKRAPRWMQEVGMEWFYRLQLEPKRLFRRYTTTNALFIYLIVRELIKKI